MTENPIHIMSVRNVGLRKIKLNPIEFRVTWRSLLSQIERRATKIKRDLERKEDEKLKEKKKKKNKNIRV